MAKGECLAVLGANGTGKTTLLKILDGLVFPTSGTVRFLGRPLSEGALTDGFGPFFRSSVALVFSEPEVQLFSPTVYDELAFGPLQTGLSDGEVKTRVEETADMLGIGALLSRAPHRLSAGEKKKVAIASALTVNPSVILMDEPTSGLDPRSQVWLLELLWALKDAGKTLVMATHDLSLAGDAADRAVVLDESHRVAGEGPAACILRDKALLLRVNLIHRHSHRHGHLVHTHSHGPFSVHDEHD